MVAVGIGGHDLLREVLAFYVDLAEQGLCASLADVDR
jgi:hypothetical protein